MIFDFLKPVTYMLEKGVVGKIIPDASVVPNRKLLKDYPIGAEDLQQFDHSLWSDVLQRHVKKDESLGDIHHVNVVDYDGVAADRDFQTYLDALAAANPEELHPVQQLAFWMNSYNALCINLIVSHEKKTGEALQSINNLSKPNQPVWDMVAGQVSGQAISLNEIEHEKLRKQWAEPAVHGCIVCASASCPNLRPQAFGAENLRQQMDEAVKDWLSNPTKGLLLSGNHRLELSRIFLWFEKDFGGFKGVREWIPQYLDDEVAGTVRKGRISTRYFAYDWSINRAPKATK